MAVKHHPKCAARAGEGHCDRPVPCAAIQQAIDAFNADDTKTRRGHPDRRERYWARWPIFATDCDYEIGGFSGVCGKMLEPLTPDSNGDTE